MIIGVAEIVAGVGAANMVVGPGVTEADLTCISALRHYQARSNQSLTKLIAIRKYCNSPVFIGIRTAMARMVYSGGFVMCPVLGNRLQTACQLKHPPPLSVVVLVFAGVVEEVVLLARWDRGVGGEAMAPFGEFGGVTLFGA